MIVIVQDTKGDIFSQWNKEETEYEDESLNSFGFKGSMKMFLRKFYSRSIESTVYQFKL